LLASLPAQGLLEKQPSLRLDWPQLLDHPFLAETAADKERQAREAALLAAQKAEAEAAPTLQSRVQSGAAAAADGEAHVGRRRHACVQCSRLPMMPVCKQLEYEVCCPGIFVPMNYVLAAHAHARLPACLPACSWLMCCSFRASL